MTSDTEFSLKIETPPTTLREMALDRMRDAIIAGYFDSGQRLVERKLCDQLGVSRSIIREVIRHLETEGLVEMLPHQGPIVARLDWDKARQIYDIRSTLECSAVADCASHADAETKSRLQAALAGLDNTDSDTNPTTVLAATTRFYEIVFESAGHQIAWGIVQRLNSRISRLRVMTLGTNDRMVVGPSRIRKIFSAIEQNDPEEATKACQLHIAEARAIAESILRDDA